MRLPLILSCSFIVNVNDKDTDFKPEYIIPQLLIEAIIKRNRKERRTKKLEEIIIGVIFTSTHISDKFEFPMRVFDNIAIPVLDVYGSTGYCDM